MDLSPLVFSVDGMMIRETEVFVKRLAKNITLKWERLFSRSIDYLLTQLNIAYVQATHQTMQRLRIYVQDISHALPVFEDGTGITLLL